MPTGVRRSFLVSAITKQLKKPAVQLVRNTELLNQVSYCTSLHIAGPFCTLHSVCMSVCPLCIDVYECTLCGQNESGLVNRRQRTCTKLNDRSQQQKVYFSTWNELLFLRMFSTLYKIIFRLLPNVVDVEWMHTYFEHRLLWPILLAFSSHPCQYVASVLLRGMYFLLYLSPETGLARSRRKFYDYFSTLVKTC